MDEIAASGAFDKPELRSPKGTELVELTVGRIDAHVQAHELGAGDRLPPERQLAAELGVSRATVREALHELELKGLLERRQGRGTVIVGADRGEIAERLIGRLDEEDREVLELMDFREAIEVPVAARAARYATSADVARLKRTTDRMASALSRERFAKLDSLFHSQLAQASHNVLLVRVIEWSSRWTLATRSEPLEDTHRRRVSLQGHRAILNAIVDRDAEGAAAAMSAHLRAVTEELTRRD